MTPPESNQHLCERVLIPAHPETVQQGRAIESVTEEKSADDGVCLIDDSFRERMVIIGYVSDCAIWKEEILMLERVSSADGLAVQRKKELVIQGIISRWRKPAWRCPRVEHEILVCASCAKPLVELRDRRFVFLAIGLDNNRQAYFRVVCSFPSTICATFPMLRICSMSSGES
jgi:hypothetical protein